jgi:thiamine pyrophosphate-dependent acetolactate synthase large subunit-like protein
VKFLWTCSLQAECKAIIFIIGRNCVYEPIKEEVTMGHQRQDVERTKQYAKKFVRYKEGAEKYSLGLTKFQALAKEAKAVYKIDGIALVNCEIFERFLESFREC